MEQVKVGKLKLWFSTYGKYPYPTHPDYILPMVDEEYPWTSGKKGKTIATYITEMVGSNDTIVGYAKAHIKIPVTGSRRSIRHWCWQRCIWEE